jgi:hypothetical protein
MQLKHSLRGSSVLLAALVIGLAGCNPFGVSEEDELADAERDWKRSNIRAYSFEMRTSCFCPPEVTDWARVTVQDGAIVAATSLTGAPLSGIARDSRKSVDQLFDSVKRPYPDWVDRVDFTFDPLYRYPVKLQLESRKNISDAGIIYEARNLQPFIAVD